MTDATTEIRERPILFSGPMVRAILEDRKTQTRRVIVPQPTEAGLEWIETPEGFSAWQDNGLLLDEQSEDGGPCQRLCPYGRPGDRLWVRETWCEIDRNGWAEVDQPRDYLSTRYGVPRRNGCAYLADSLRNGHEDADSRRCREELGYRWSPSIHMPRWASRITLEISGVRVERLQGITEDDARAEGVDARPQRDRPWFSDLWDSINAKRGHGWDANPWVWAISYRRVDR